MMIWSGGGYVWLAVQNLSWAITSFFFNIGIPYLAHRLITMRLHVMYIHDLFMTLTLDLKVFQHMYTIFGKFPLWDTFYFVVWCRVSILGLLVNHYETMYDLDLWTEVKIIGFLIFIPYITWFFFEQFFTKT